MERKGSVNARAYRSFVFDFDRTLVTMPVDWVSVRKEVERISGERLDRTFMFPQIKQMLAHRPELREPLFSTIDSFELKAAGATRPVEGAVDLLARLSRSSRLALVTMQGRAVYEVIAREQGLGGFFGATITRENSLDRGEQILMAVRAINSSPEITLFIGDMDNDVVGARKARVEVVIMGNRPLATQTPDYKFSSFAELKAFLV